MRWLLIGLLISVAALVLVAAAGARHIWRQRRRQAGDSDLNTGPKIEAGADTGKADLGKSGEDV